MANLQVAFRGKKIGKILTMTMQDHDHIAYRILFNKAGTLKSQEILSDCKMVFTMETVKGIKIILAVNCIPFNTPGLVLNILILKNFLMLRIFLKFD